MGLFSGPKNNIETVLPGIEWEVAKLQLSELRPSEENPRTISEEGFDTLVEKIRSQGFHRALVLDFDRKTILGGNQGFRALLQLGKTEAYCIIPSRALSDTERKKIILTDNKHDGEWNLQELANFAPDEMLVDLGFVGSELKDFKGAFDNASGQDEKLEDEISGPGKGKGTQRVVVCPNCQFEFTPEKPKKEADSEA